MEEMPDSNRNALSPPSTFDVLVLRKWWHIGDFYMGLSRSRQSPYKLLLEVLFLPENDGLPALAM